MYSASTGGCIWSKERWRPKRRSRVILPRADQEPQLIKASIVAIHGLNPLNDKDHALNTWRKPKKAEGMLWLRDCLPQTTPKARIPYTNTTLILSLRRRRRDSFTKPTTCSRGYILHEIWLVWIAFALCGVADAGKDHERPLIIIAHSLGGILAKQVL